MDTTGFSTQTYLSWRNVRHGSFRHHDWLKLHAAVTSVLKAIPCMEVTDGEEGDSPQLAGLLNALDDVNAVAADSAYLSRRNCDLIEAAGAKPFIKLKRNIAVIRSFGSKAWKNMLLDYRKSPEEWMKIYHFRSSAETAFSALKRKFGHKLSSIRRDLQRKELMIKVIAYNLSILTRII